MKKTLHSMFIVLLLVGCADDEQQIESKEMISDDKKYRFIDPRTLPKKPPPDNAVLTDEGAYMIPVGHNSEGCVYYRPYNPGAISTMPLYFLHKSGGFSHSSEGCTSELD